MNVPSEDSIIDMPGIVSLDPSSVVCRYDSPGYRTTPPEVEHFELVSPEYRAMMQSLWHRQVDDHTIACHRILGGIVEGPGLVFDRELRLIEQTIHQATSIEIELAWTIVKEHMDMGRPIWVPGVTLLCEKAGIGNYGHWLVEMLPIVYLNLYWLRAGEWKLRVPAMGGAMGAVVADSLALLGVPQEQAVARLPGPQQYEHLIVAEGLSQHGQWYSPRIMECFEALGRDVLPVGKSRVWVSRVGDARSLANEAELCGELAANGWTIANPAAMTLREQIALFKGAIEIAGVTGAGLTNLAFAPRGATVTAFTPARMPDVFFSTLAQFRGQRYREIRCAQDDDAGGQGFSTTLRMSTREVMRFLDQ